MNKEEVLKEFGEIFDAADEVLSEWKSEQKIKFPELMGMLAVRMNMTDKRARQLEGVVRYYVRNHPDWYMIQGANGGIMPRSQYQKKQDDKLSKLMAKQQLKTAIETKVAAVNNKPVNVVTNVVDDSDEVEELADE
jgi:hypothetical protein